MQAAIGYLRVSTREQGRSGLGLAAQRHDIESFGAREGFRPLNRGIRTFRLALARTRCYASRARRGSEGCSLGTVPADCLETGPSVAERPLHHWAHGAQGALRCCSPWSRLRRLHTAHLCIACGTRAKVDLGTDQGCEGGCQG